MSDIVDDCHRRWECRAMEIELAQASAKLVEQAQEIDRLRAALREIGELPGELNPSNYTHDDVCILNDAHIEAWAIARAALGGRDELSESIRHGDG